MLQVAGHRGELRAGYQVAAELGPWRLVQASRLPRQYEVSAAVVSVSDYWFAQRPLVLALEIGPDIWMWGAVEPAVTGSRVVAVACGHPVIARGAAKQEQRA